MVAPNATLSFCWLQLRHTSCPLAIFVAFYVVLQARAFAEEVSTNNIREAWKRREAQSNTMLIKWTESRVQKVRLTTQNGPEGARREQKLVTIPQFTSQLLVDGTKARYDTRLVSLSTPGALRDVPCIAAYDGNAVRSLTGQLGVSVQYGSISADKRLEEWKSLALKAPLAVYRPLSPGVLGGESLTMKLLPGTTLVQGRRCRALQIASRDSPEVATVWCDLGDDALPLRLVKKSVTGGLRCEVAFTYSGVWGEALVLEGWETSFVDPKTGNIMESVRATGAVVDLQPTVNDKDFIVKFPPGCTVWDKRVFPPKKMISNGGDDLRPVTPPKTKSRNLTFLHGGVAVFCDA